MGPAGRRYHDYGKSLTGMRRGARVMEQTSYNLLCIVCQCMGSKFSLLIGIFPAVNCHSGFRSSPYLCTDAVHDPARFIRYEYGVTLNTFISNSFYVTAKLDCIVWF